MVDAGVMAWLLGLNPEKISRSDPAVLTDYGHLIETFAVGEILAFTHEEGALVVPLDALWR